MNLFQEAARNKWRFPTARGLLSVEQLFELPLTEVDAIAQELHKDLEKTKDKSFLKNNNRPRAEAYLQNQFNLVLEVIKIRQDEIDEAEHKAAKAAKKQKLVDLLAKRKDEAFNEMSESEIEKALAELD